MTWKAFNSIKDYLNKILKTLARPKNLSIPSRIIGAEINGTLALGADLILSIPSRIIKDISPRELFDAQNLSIPSRII